QPIPEARVVRPEPLRPGPVAELAHAAGRVDDVREQERREHAMREGLEVLGPPSVPIRLFHRGTAPSSFDRACVCGNAGMVRALGSTFVAALHGWWWGPRVREPPREPSVEPPRPPLVTLGGAP